MIKKINSGDVGQVRERILAGITKMNEIVSLTLGPAGLSVIIERGAGEPLIVDDGRRAAEAIKLDDPIEQLAVRTCYSVTRKTDEMVGDGTSTSMVLTHAIVKEVFDEYPGYGGRGNVMKIDADIQTAKDMILEELDALAKPIKTEKELIDVATVAAGDPELGKTIGSMYHKLGKDGHLTLEFNLLSNKIETEIVKGYRFMGAYAAKWMRTSELRQISNLDDIDVLVVNQKLTDPAQIQTAASLIINSGKDRMVIIAPKFSPSIIKTILANVSKRNPFIILAIRAPGRSDEVYKDIATFTGGRYFSLQDDLGTLVKEDFGHVDNIEATDDTTILTGGAGKDVDVKKRIKEVKADEKMQKLHQFKNERNERVSALGEGVGVIKIGAPTDEARNWLKHKIEDAKYATKVAFKEGVVPGGGLTLKKISEKLPEDNVLKGPLLAPYNTLVANSGGKFTVAKNVIDPVMVVKAGLENACSAASKIIRIGAAIASKPADSLVEELGGLIGRAQAEEDLIQEDNG